MVVNNYIIIILAFISNRYVLEMISYIVNKRMPKNDIEKKIRYSMMIVWRVLLKRDFS